MNDQGGSGEPQLAKNLLRVADGELPLTFARAGGTGAAIVIMPSAFGVAPDLEAQMMELARDARLVTTFDPFFREDPGPASYVDMPRVLTRLRTLDGPRADRDLRAAIDWTRGQAGGGPVVALGICFGAPYTMRAAADGAVDGLVTWHGSGMERHLARAAEMRCPMRLHFGGVDPFVPASAVDAVRAAFVGRPDVWVSVHEGATHGFSHRAAEQAYDEHAERAGMASVRELVGVVARR